MPDKAELIVEGKKLSVSNLTRCCIQKSDSPKDRWSIITFGLRRCYCRTFKIVRSR